MKIDNLILEGGNATAIDRITGEPKAEAQKIDLTKVQRKLLKKEFIKTFSILNDLVKNKFGKPIWNDFDVIKKGLAFNGSSTYMFSNDISDEEFIKYKPKVGDIDLTVPRDRMVDLFAILSEYEDKKIGNIEYIGSNRKSASEFQQINAVFKFKVNDDYTAYAQVDFEPSDYKDDKPTEWDSFSHNSDWEDIKKGFKGVNHKYALTILAHIVSKDFNKLPNIMLLPNADNKNFYVVTPTIAKKFASVTSKELGKNVFANEQEVIEAFVKAGLAKKPPAHILKKSKAIPVIVSHYLAFSVSKGLRVKYAPLVTKDKKPIMIDNKMVLIALDSKGASAEQNLREIFKLFFNHEPTKSDLKKMHSFIGVIELLKEMNLPNKTKAYEQFLNELIDEKLWGTKKGRAQELERDSKELDAKIKWAMVNYIMKELKVGDLNKIKKIANDYYADWKGNSNDEIREKLDVQGKKLSEIFEQIECSME